MFFPRTPPPRFFPGSSCGFKILHCMEGWKHGSLRLCAKYAGDTAACGRAGGNACATAKLLESRKCTEPLRKTVDAGRKTSFYTIVQSFYKRFMWMFTSYVAAKHIKLYTFHKTPQHTLNDLPNPLH